MVFGRKDPTCPRCQELLAGAKPVRWSRYPVSHSLHGTMLPFTDIEIKGYGIGR